MAAKERRFDVPESPSTSQGNRETRVDAVPSHLSFLHRRPCKTLLQPQDLKKNRTEITDGRTGQPRRMYKTTFPFIACSSESFLLITLGLTHYPEHDDRIIYPPCVQVFLNGQMKLEVTPEDTIPYPEITLEVSISDLILENALIVTWMDPVVPPVVPFAVSVYMARRKASKAVVEEISGHVKPLNQCVAEEYIRSASDDDEVIATGTRSVSLICSVSKKRPVIPVRGKDCPHVECFDAASFVTVNFSSSKSRWKCPYCSRTVLAQDLLVDELFKELLKFTDHDKLNIVRDETGITVRESSKDNIVIDVVENDDFDDVPFLSCISAPPTQLNGRNTSVPKSTQCELSILEDLNEYDLYGIGGFDFIDDNMQAEESYPSTDADDDQDKQESDSNDNGDKKVENESDNEDLKDMAEAEPYPSASHMPTMEVDDDVIIID